MKIEPGTFCPLLKKDCIQMKCAWFMHLVGKNNNTGADIDEWGCAIAWMPALMIENSNQQRQTSASVDSFRNEMSRQNEDTHRLMLHQMRREDEQRKLLNMEKS